MVRKIKPRTKPGTAKAKPAKTKKAKRKLAKSAKKAGPKAANRRKKKAVSKAEAIARDNFAYGMGFLIP